MYKCDYYFNFSMKISSEISNRRFLFYFSVDSGYYFEDFENPYLYPIQGRPTSQIQAPCGRRSLRFGMDTWSYCIFHKWLLIFRNGTQVPAYRLQDYNWVSNDISVYKWI